MLNETQLLSKHRSFNRKTEYYEQDSGNIQAVYIGLQRSTGRTQHIMHQSKREECTGVKEAQVLILLFISIPQLYGLEVHTHPHSHSTPPTACPDTAYTPYSMNSSHLMACIGTAPEKQKL